MGRMPQPRVQEQAVGQGPQSHTVPWGREGLGGMRGMAGTLGGQCRFLPRERGRKREGVSGPGPGGFLLVLMPPWFSPLARPPPPSMMSCPTTQASWMALQPWLASQRQCLSHLEPRGPSAPTGLPRAWTVMA